MDGKKPVSFGWLRSTQGEGVWADNPAIEGLPQAWLTLKGEVLGKIADVQEIEDGYGVWLAGQDESVSVADGSPYFAAWLDETPAPAPTPSLADEMSETARVIRESLGETPAPAPTPAIVETLPLVRTPSADDMRGWLRSLNLMWTDYDAYTEYDYYLQDIDTDSKAHHNAVAFSEMVKAAIDAIKAVIDAIDPDEPPYDQCPKCKHSDSTWLVYERDAFATFACKCGESWSFESGTRVL